jgi:hypothetical protein
VRLITFNVASIDGRIAISASTPSWLDTRWQLSDQFEPVDVLSLHGARVSLQGSNSFTGRDAPPANFDAGRDVESPAGDFPAVAAAHSFRPLVRGDRQPCQGPVDHC